MEDHLADAATADFLVKIGWHLAGGIIALGVGVISTLLWGRGGRKRLLARLDALEKENRTPSITQTVNFHGSPLAAEHERHLRNAIDAETVRSLKGTIRQFPQRPLSDGHTYAKLPDGTNIVSMADGSYRLALPVRLSVDFDGGLEGSLNLSPEVKKRPPATEDDDGGEE